MAAPPRAAPGWATAENVTGERPHRVLPAAVAVVAVLALVYALSRTDAIDRAWLWAAAVLVVAWTAWATRGEWHR